MIPQPSQSMDSYIPNGHDDNTSPFPIVQYSGWIRKSIISRVHWENVVYDAQCMIIISFTQRFLFLFIHMPCSPHFIKTNYIWCIYIYIHTI